MNKRTKFNGPRPKMTKKSWSVIKRLFSYIFRHYKLHCFFVIIFIIVGALANIRGTLFLKDLIDIYIIPYINSDVPNFAPLLNAILTMGAIYYVGVFSTWIYNRIMITVSQGTMRDIRKDIFSSMEKLPIKYFDTNAHGDIMSIYTNDTDTLRQMISQSFPQMFSAVITVAGAFVSMLILNIPLTIVTMFMVGIMFLTTKKIAGSSGKYFAEQQRNLGKLNGYIEEMMEGQKVVKVFCHEEECIDEFDELNNKLFESANSANKYANILMPVMSNMGNLSYVLIAIIGSILALSGIGGFTLGSIASFLQLNRTFNLPIAQMSMQLNAIVMAIAGAERIFDLMDQEAEVDDGNVELVNATKDSSGNLVESDKRTHLWAWKKVEKSGDATYTPLEGDIIFDHVDFGYNDEKIILHDIELYARPGEKIAFVGATGAGKTTITNLINRFYDIQDGKIRYDGININKIKKDDLRRSLGIVLQDTHLFTGTVMENIRYGRLDASDEEVFEAARLANADKFIKHLPNGYDTMLTGDGSNLSQGQRQLLAIARAAIADPPVLILDEATSSIDTRTEKIVQQGMDRLMEGRTVFVIAHRLSTIKNSNVIMVLDKGRIVERGNHDTLLDKKGIYYQLYTGTIEQD